VCVYTMAHHHLRMSFTWWSLRAPSSYFLASVHY